MIDVKFVRHVRSISKENTIFITLAKDVTFLSEIFSKGGCFTSRNVEFAVGMIESMILIHEVLTEILPVADVSASECFRFLFLLKKNLDLNVNVSVAANTWLTMPKRAVEIFYGCLHSCSRDLAR